MTKEYVDRRSHEYTLKLRPDSDSYDPKFWDEYCPLADLLPNLQAKEMVGEDCPKTGTPHIQIVIILEKNNTRLSTVFNKLKMMIGIDRLDIQHIYDLVGSLKYGREERVARLRKNT